MSNQYTFLLEELLPHQAEEEEGKSEVRFFWNVATQAWSVTLNGNPVSDAVAATLIAAAEALGMVPPESENDDDYELRL